MGRSKRKVKAIHTNQNDNLPLSGGDNTKKNLALSLRYFSGKPNAWDVVMRDKKNQKSFIKFIKTLATLNYGELMTKGNHYYTAYPPGTNFSRGFNIPQATKGYFAEEKIIGISPDGRNSPFRIFGYVVEQHFCIIWFDPQHKALPS